LIYNGSRVSRVSEARVPVQSKAKCVRGYVCVGYVVRRKQRMCVGVAVRVCASEEDRIGGFSMMSNHSLSLL
jgi:hypothetical protein